MTAQELFNKSVLHLRTQKVQSLNFDEEHGAYRSYNQLGKTHKVLMCSIGCLIPNEEFRHFFEGKAISDLLDNRMLSLNLHKELAPHRSLLMALQGLHDNNPPFEWERLFKEIAETYHLELP